ncbi:MAG: dihydrofolate reductase [Candidatus Nanosyncoccaceae bacterium]|jgi:dihydrofolate reductase
MEKAIIPVYAIAVVGQNRELGIGDNLLGNFPTDMEYFARTTKGAVVIMGRKTFDSLRKKPLPDRINIVLSRDQNFKFEGVHVAKDHLEALELAWELANGRNIFVIGGESVYRQYLKDNLIDQIYLTEIQADFPEADKFFPFHPSLTITSNWHLIQQETVEADGITMHFSVYKKSNKSRLEELTEKMENWSDHEKQFYGYIPNPVE